AEAYRGARGSHAATSAATITAEGTAAGRGAAADTLPLALRRGRRAHTTDPICCLTALLSAASAVSVFCGAPAGCGVPQADRRVVSRRWLLWANSSSSHGARGARINMTRIARGRGPRGPTVVGPHVLVNTRVLGAHRMR